MTHAIVNSIEIKKDVQVSYMNNIITVSGKKGTVMRELYYPDVIIEVIEDKEVIIKTNSTKKEQKAIVGTYTSHINNMITGVTNGFEYKMIIVYSHFPMQTKVENQKFIINNFLGEKKPRVAKIVGLTTVKISGNSVIVSGISKEDVGQTAANIENRCKIKRFDPRVFQDGIYIVEK